MAKAMRQSAPAARGLPFCLVRASGDASPEATSHVSDCPQEVHHHCDDNFEKNGSAGPLAPRPRLERGTYCLGVIPETRPDVARRGLACRFAAMIMAGRGLMWPCACGRWLPVWLPIISLARLIFESRDPMRSPDRESSHDLTRISEARACGWRRPMRCGS